MPNADIGNEDGTQYYPLAPMSGLYSLLTFALLALPAVFLLSDLLWTTPLAIPAAALIAIFAWVWLRFRPSAFKIRRSGIEVIWPLKRQEIPMADIVDVRVIDRSELAEEIGWRIRIGAGGLWGVFGWLRTQRRGTVQTYISRTDRFVWIECTPGTPWLITPEQSDSFVAALRGRFAQRA